jgi:hypothetical protein
MTLQGARAFLPVSEVWIERDTPVFERDSFGELLVATLLQHGGNMATRSRMIREPAAGSSPRGAAIVPRLGESLFEVRKNRGMDELPPAAAKANIAFRNRAGINPTVRAVL